MGLDILLKKRKLGLISVPFLECIYNYNITRFHFSILNFLICNSIVPIAEHLYRLHMILKPFMLRRVKTDVENELSDKIEIMVYCPLTTRQKRLYTGNLILDYNIKIKYVL